MPTKPLSKQWYFAFTGVPMICSSFLFVYDKMYFVEVNPCMFLLWQQQQQVKRRCSFCRSHPKTKERTGRAFLIIMIFIFLASSYLFLASSFSLFLSGNISCLLVHLIDQTSPTSAPFRSLLIRTSFLKRREIQFFFLCTSILWAKCEQDIGVYSDYSVFPMYYYFRRKNFQINQKHEDSTHRSVSKMPLKSLELDFAAGIFT